MDINELIRLRDILVALVDAEYTLDTEEQNLSTSNKVLASSGVKAEVLGTLSSVPTISAKDLSALHPDLVTPILSKAAELRARAVALRTEDTK